MLEASSETSRLEDQITDEELERRESVAVKLLRRRKQMASNYSSIETISLVRSRLRITKWRSITASTIQKESDFENEKTNRPGISWSILFQWVHQKRNDQRVIQHAQKTVLGVKKKINHDINEVLTDCTPRGGRFQLDYLSSEFQIIYLNI